MKHRLSGKEINREINFQFNRLPNLNNVERKKEMKSNKGSGREKHRTVRKETG